MTFIIAEIGSNWTTIDECCKSIVDAKAAGADAVKFQMFDPDELNGNVHGLHRHWVPDLAMLAKGVGIEFMASAFSPDGIRFLDPYVKRHKIASCECMWPELRDAAVATGKPLIVSLGACTPEEMDFVVSTYPKDRTTFLYCAGAYPARYVHLGVIEGLKAQNLHAGYSDHTDDVLGIPYIACRLYGGEVLEKHVTAFPELMSPDRPHSITMEEFGYMVRAIHSGYVDHPTPEEIPMATKWRRTAERNWQRGT